jgi:cytochrome P450
MSSTGKKSSTQPPFDFFARHRDDLFDQYDRQRSTEPVYWEPALGTWVLSRYEDVSAVLNDETAETIELSKSIAEFGRKTNRKYDALIKLMRSLRLGRRRPFLRRLPG